MIIEFIAVIIALMTLRNVTEVPAPELDEETEWELFNLDAFHEYADEFDAIFNSLSVTSKRTDKGLRVTVKRANGKLGRSYTVKGK
jgi:hypothetical protein